MIGLGENGWGHYRGGLYIPFEVRHLVHWPSIINAAVLMGNIFVVSFLAYQLSRRHRYNIARQ